MIICHVCSTFNYKRLTSQHKMSSILGPRVFHCESPSNRCLTARVAVKGGKRTKTVVHAFPPSWLASPFQRTALNTLVCTLSVVSLRRRRRRGLPRARRGYPRRVVPVARTDNWRTINASRISYFYHRVRV